MPFFIVDLFVYSLNYLQVTAFLHPQDAAGIAGHAPITAGAQRATAYFRTVRKATAFKLLGKETTTKNGEPFFYDILIVHARIWKITTKGLLGQHIYLRRPETETKKIIKQEIMKFIRTYQVFCLLFYFTVRGGRYQFRTDWGVDNIEQGGARQLVDSAFCHPFHKMAHQRL